MVVYASSMQNDVEHAALAPFSAWPIVRRRLVPLWLILGFANLITTALHQREFSITLSIAAFVMPVVAGYKARRRGGSYGNALHTAWLTIVVSILLSLPLAFVGLATGVLPVQLPPGFHIDATATVIVAVATAIVLPIVMVAMWITWIPCTLIGAWIAGGPD
jgi:hypothetical protein